VSVQYPAEIAYQIPYFWLNVNRAPAATVLPKLPLQRENLEEAKALWDRMAPLIQHCFPYVTDGKVDSPLRVMDYIGKQFTATFNMQPNSMVKLDNELPIAGSVKARGGVFEVLKFAERVALESGLLKEDDSRTLMASDPALRALLSKHKLVVGSTGNLGLAVGIMGAALGMRLTVHVSSNAKQWKKEMLTQIGAKVVEHAGDYTEAVRMGRETASTDPLAHFVDGETSLDLILGYSTAAYEIVRQLLECQVWSSIHPCWS
jgi:D-serine dehydratase